MGQHELHDDGWHTVLEPECGHAGDEHTHDAGRQVHVVLLLEATRVGYVTFWLAVAAYGY